MPMPYYIYQRDARPLVQWRGGFPPRPIRAADNVALGQIETITMIPGGPEAIQGLTLTGDSLYAFLFGAAVGGVLTYMLTGAYVTRPRR